MSRQTFRLVAAQSADAVTFLVFYVCIGAGVHVERNPLILGLMALGGIQAVAVAKIGLAALIGWRHDRRVVLSPRYVWFRTVMMSVGAAAGIVGAGFNSAAIISSIH